MAFRLTLWLVLVFGIKTITGDRTCEYSKKNYTECTVMLYTKWTPCNGTDCDMGLQKRDKGICCPASSKNDTITIIKEACKRNCNISDSDFYELKKYIPPSTILTTEASSPAIKTTIITFSPTTLARTSSPTTELLANSQTSSGPMKTHGSNILVTSSKAHDSTITSSYSKTHGSSGSTVHPALGKAHVSTIVSVVNKATVKSTRTSTRATPIKGTTRSAVKTSIPASTVSSSSVSSSSKGNGASNASQLSRNKLQEEGGTGGGVIAGAIIGVLAVAGLSGLLAFFLYRRWKKNKEERKVEPEENGGENPVSQKPPVSTSLN